MLFSWARIHPFHSKFHLQIPSSNSVAIVYNHQQDDIIHFQPPNPTNVNIQNQITYSHHNIYPKFNFLFLYGSLIALYSVVDTSLLFSTTAVPVHTTQLGSQPHRTRICHIQISSYHLFFSLGPGFRTVSHPLPYPQHPSGLNLTP